MMGRYKGKRESGGIGDPFQPQKPGKLQKFSQAVKRFFQTTEGKVAAGVACCLVVLVIGVVIGLKNWIKAPDVSTGTDDQLGQTVDADVTGAQGLSDEELYPDDGYNGDVPTVSGDRKEGVYTFLLVGTDKGDGNTDTIMVVTYDTVNQDINIMSIPRDTMINASWDIKKINSVYSRSTSGLDALMNQVRKLIGFRPDFYVKVDLEMFVQLVDLVGGVEFDVPQDMNYDDDWQDLHIHLTKGTQTLDGEKAMELVRFRKYSEGDIQRVQVQQDFMKALIKKCLSFGNWGKVKAYIDLALENVQTDLEFGSVVWFAANVLGLNSAPTLTMDDVYTCTLPGDYWASAYSRETQQEQSYVTIYPSEVVKLVNERFNPYQQQVTTSMLDAMSILSNGDIASSTGSLADTRHNAIMAVQRGEAYYDDSGKLVYGTKPQEDEEEPADGEETDQPTLPDETGGETGGQTTTTTTPTTTQPSDTTTQPVDTTTPSDNTSEPVDTTGPTEDTNTTQPPIDFDEPVLPDIEMDENAA
jgi:LCP family protein required for cell wall assembly